MRIPSRSSHLGRWRALTILALAVAIGSAGQPSLVQAAGSSNIGIWLQAEQVGGIRTICVGDTVYFRLRVIKRIGVEGEFSLRMTAGINVAAEVADGSGGVGSISPPSSYTSLDSFPMPGTTSFGFKAEKAGRATLFFSARVNQVWFLGYEVSFNTVRTQVQLKVEDCEYAVTATSRWHGFGLNYTALVSDIRLSSSGGGRYTGSGLWTFLMTDNPAFSCAPTTQIYQAPVELTGQLDGDQLTVEVAYERPTGWYHGRHHFSDCNFTNSESSVNQFPEPITFTVRASGATLSLVHTLGHVIDHPSAKLPGGAVLVTVAPVAPR